MTKITSQRHLSVESFVETLHVFEESNVNRRKFEENPDSTEAQEVFEDILETREVRPDRPEAVQEPKIASPLGKT